MSLVFRKTFQPPDIAPWKTWVNEGPFTEFEKKYTLYAIDYISKIFTLPNEIYDLIAYFIFNNYLANEPYLWPGKHDKIASDYKHEGNYVDWMNFWISDVRQQTYNPIKVVKNTFDITSARYLKNINVDQCAVIINKCIQHNILDDHFTFSMPKLGECSLGFSFPPNFDISHITKCALKFNNLEMRTLYNFSKENSIDITDELGIQHTFWQCPFFKVIPIVLLYFNDITVNFTLKDGCLPPQNVNIINVISSISCMREICCLNVDDNMNAMCIANGSFAYVNTFY